MILPIVAYGDPVLRKVGKAIDKDYPNLEGLIADMEETMRHAQGVGLAAPQIGKAIRLFLVDTAPFAEDPDLDKEEQSFLKNFHKVFINARIVEESGEHWSFNEGCLSIPDIREEVSRQETITIEYYDAQFIAQRETISGLAARVIQHEYDHIEGILFTDKIASLKKRLLRKKLDNISKGKVRADYRMRFPLSKRN